jgi:hypothetical protein
VSPACPWFVPRRWRGKICRPQKTWIPSSYWRLGSNKGGAFLFRTTAQLGGKSFARDQNRYGTQDAAVTSEYSFFTRPHSEFFWYVLWGAESRSQTLSVHTKRPTFSCSTDLGLRDSFSHVTPLFDTYPYVFHPSKIV